MDAERRVTRLEVRQPTLTEITDYIYDAEGNLTERITETDTFSEHVWYTYGQLTYINEVDKLAAAENAFTISGNVITAGSVNVEIYNLQGVKTADIAAGTSIELPAGIYVAKTPDSASKIAIK